MAGQGKAASAAKGGTKGGAKKEGGGLRYCSLPEVKERTLSSSVSPGRASLIMVSEKKWVSGTTLHYYFFDEAADGEYVYFSDGTREWRTWTAEDDQKDVVRAAFDVWKDVGIGISFEEVDSRDEAEIRIGFMKGDGAWSYVGRDIRDIGAGKRTMNFGWDLTWPGEVDTAVHEIGHTLGFPHEHQNPNAGIVWDEEAVYAELGGPPNNWPREQTFYNIIRKIPPDTVQGSNWDPNSIMHYQFGPGLIKSPAEFATGLRPAPGLSARDKTWVRTFYPPIEPKEEQELGWFDLVRLDIAEGQQKSFVIKPEATRWYTIQTFGVSDTVMVLFEDENGELRYLTGDDDSGQDTNAKIEVKLQRGRRYVLRLRLYYSDRSGKTAVLMW